MNVYQIHLAMRMQHVITPKDLYLCTCDPGYSGDGFTCNGKTLMRNTNIRKPITQETSINNA